MTEKCPVCGKSGLPDYSKIPSVCPQCNSDLNGYFLIGQAQKAIQRKNRVLAGLFLCFFVSMTLLVLAAQRIYNSEEENSGLAGDKNQINLRNLEFLTAETNREENIQIRYVIRKGDNLSTIARFFYGDWRHYKQIMIDNLILDEFHLIPNDTLLIKVRIE